MKFLILLFTVSLATLVISTPIFSQNLDSNLTVQGKWTIGSCNSVFVKDNSAFISSGRGIRIMDISNPDYPVQVSQVSTGSVVNDIFVQNNLVFIATGDFINIQSGLTIVDISDINHPQILSVFNTEGEAATCVTAKRNFAYIGYIGSLTVLDISNPASPQQIKYFALPQTPHSVFILNNNLYVADQSSGTLIIDITQITNPSTLGTYYTDNIGWNYAENGHSIYKSGDFVYMSTDHGFKIIDVSDFGSPILRSSYRTIGTTKKISVIGNYAYLASDIPVLSIIDVSNSKYLKETGHINLSHSKYSGFVDMSVNNGYAYVMCKIKLLRYLLN